MSGSQALGTSSPCKEAELGVGLGVNVSVGVGVLASVELGVGLGVSDDNFVWTRITVSTAAMINGAAYRFLLFIFGFLLGAQVWYFPLCRI